MMIKHYCDKCKEEIELEWELMIRKTKKVLRENLGITDEKEECTQKEVNND